MQAALGEKQLGVKNILIWRISRDEGGNLSGEMFLVFAPQPWEQTELPKKGQARPRAAPHNPHPAQGYLSRLEWHCLDFSQDVFIPSVSKEQLCARGSGTAHLSLPKEKTSPCPAAPAALGTRRLKPSNTPPFPLCHHTQGWGRPNPSLVCPDPDTRGKSCS